MAIKRLLKTALVASALSFGGLIATAPAAEAAFQCTAVAFNALDRRIANTRAAVVRRFEGRACTAALSLCEENLDIVRFRTGRPRPFARCEVVGTRFVAAPGAPIAPRPGLLPPPPPPGVFPPPPRAGVLPPPPPPPGFHQGQACNFVACDNRYRSFRARDCSFQPFNGPRRRCTL